MYTLKTNKRPSSKTPLLASTHRLIDRDSLRLLPGIYRLVVCTANPSVYSQEYLLFSQDNTAQISFKKGSFDSSSFGRMFDRDFDETFLVDFQTL